MDALRVLVSGKKKRYIDEEYNLDLTYITPRLIAMSFPGEGIERLFRNSGDTVAKFLNERHGRNYLTFNLSGVHYNYAKFGNQVIDFPWPDHHAPPIDLLFKACARMNEWLLAAPINIVIVHCMAGKGRTGTLICCYLLFCGRFQYPEEALKYYRVMRFSKGGGVTQPSQKRYVNYFYQVLLGQVKGPICKLLNKVVLKTAPHYASNGCRPFLEILSGNQLLFTTKRTTRDQQIQISDNWEDSRRHDLLHRENLPLTGDILCRLYHWGVLGSTKICRFSFNTSFLPADNVLQLPKKELDPDEFYRNTKCADQFEVSLVFNNACECSPDQETSQRCMLCKTGLDEEEYRKWAEIAEILTRCRIRKKEMGTIALFATQEKDNVDTVLRTPEED